MTGHQSPAEYGQYLAQARTELDTLRETLASRQALDGEEQGMLDVIGMLGTWDPLRLISCLAAAATEDRRPGDRELWTTTQAAEHCGVKPKTYAYYRDRLGAPGPVDRQPGRDGQDLHDAAAVRKWQANRTGQGARTDLKPDTNRSGLTER